ncbi:lyase family protein [Phytohabitans sp. ZYX-F-186]|uniref:argininosuccinate lyase n=1 Tax=Phytohabitans maris TaxID=3071409 RepID=A0ABU0ZN40_9ACTN|nr:lyase family protein [Phytohabitans sp. ZYX-F-186]MDQ7908076.1 lyase family protein [Phytohabitans sp. ZYX-F-186]
MTQPPLTTYQQHHLRVTFEHHAGYLYQPMVKASEAHVVMLAERGLIPAGSAASMLRGLVTLRADRPETFTYDGTVEDVYYTLEKRLAAACGIPTGELNVQLARSRNDLDAGVFRMILRDQLLRVLAAIADAGAELLDRADHYADVVVVGYTHRRPAQPTSLGHVLAGYAEALAGEAAAYASLLAEVNRSPLGSCAFAGTDLDIDPERVAELLGFEELVVNSYEAVAGADHLMRTGALNAQSLATGARLARTLMDWLSWEWVRTPEEFTQGSTIMPQKRNPVVLEHLVSMAGAAAADAASVFNNVGAAWWEDSNNATTDVQVRLWESNDRAYRFFALLGGLFQRLEPLRPPTGEAIVATGATTTAAADALTRHGVPFRAAHSVVGRLVRAGAPATWTDAGVREVARAAGVGALTDAAVHDLVAAALQPELVLRRAQKDGPGEAAVRVQVGRIRSTLDEAVAHATGLRKRLHDADTMLAAAVAERSAR